MLDRFKALLINNNSSRPSDILHSCSLGKDGSITTTSVNSGRDSRLNDSLAKRVSRRRFLIKVLVSIVPILSDVSILSGLIGTFLLPTELLSRSTYISENAIQPGQVNTYWNWAQVHDADKLAELVSQWSNLRSRDRADRIQEYFQHIGLRSETQSYEFYSSGSKRSVISNGTNVHAICHSSRTDGSESLVLMASWLTRKPGSDVNGGDVNVRGVASVLALAKYLMTYNLWSKDIIFLIADGFLDGTHAWLKSYHGIAQSNLQTQQLDLQSGPIWAALNIDYPFHSFSHLAIEYEGINGQLPNLDFINTAAHIARWTGTSPVTIHAESLVPQYPSLLPSSEFFRKYYQAARTIGIQMVRGISGSPSGPEGIFTTYRIDAIGLFAYPAEGPHGFYTMGKVVESTLRSLNNLLERFHQSFFLYLMHSEGSFLSVGMYLIVPLLIGVGLTLKGLSMWGRGEVADQVLDPSIKNDKVHLPNQDLKRKNVLVKNRGGMIIWSLRVIFITHLLGIITFWGIVRSVQLNEAQSSWKPLGSIILLLCSPAVIINVDPPAKHTETVFEPIRLLLAGCLVSVVSVLNFPIGTALGMSVATSWTPVVGLLIGAVGFGVLPDWIRGIFYNEQVLESWILGFGFIIVLPMFLQSLIYWLMKLNRKN
ncbi:Gaa1-like protein [Phakopsora pachyrhizi]|uniref:Gaa1-like protein n=1 Tax=Phakopsora pachyrhizi TaxID=170000 RepID=A0AAV0BP67_PHAPC|nr:Gaa1-like protein [Phakopsora pachyrhizi]CAH7688501.1 Gaa1-like protein [Phakopsora pachyrhizi]